MSTLAGRSPALTYPELLKIASTSGITSTLSTVEDGDGTASALKISTTGIEVSNATFTGTVTGHLNASLLAISNISGTGYLKKTGTSSWVVDAGAVGPQGPAGPTGPTGPTGLTGPAGPVYRIPVQSSLPTGVSTGDLWWDTESGKLYVYVNDGDSNQWVAAIPGGTIGSRGIFSATTSSIAPNSTVNLTVPSYKAYALFKIQTDAAAWVRVYTNAAKRTADASRLSTVDPDPSAGVIAEVLTTSADTIVFSPSVIGFNDESTVAAEMPVAITNLSGTTRTVTATFTMVKLET